MYNTALGKGDVSFIWSEMKCLVSGLMREHECGVLSNYSIARMSHKTRWIQYNKISLG